MSVSGEETLLRRGTIQRNISFRDISSGEQFLLLHCRAKADTKGMCSSQKPVWQLVLVREAGHCSKPSKTSCVTVSGYTEQ